MFDLEITKDILKKFNDAKRIALIGTGGNLSICQHMASDIYRHTGKFCFAPDSVNQTALGGDGDWREPWLRYAQTSSDLIIAVTSRIGSPLIKTLETIEADVLVLAPHAHDTLPTIAIQSSTYHEFECKALWSLYMLMERNGVKLPELK